MIGKLFRQNANSLILTAMTNTICLLIDNIIIGRLLGIDAMSAYGFAAPLLIIYAALGSMLINGVQVRLGHAMGRGDMAASNACYSAAITLSLSLAVLCIFIVFVAGNPLCTLLGAAKSNAFPMTKSYLRGYMLGAPFYFLNQVATVFLQSLGKRQQIVTSVFVMTIADVAFDLLSVFVFRGGMFGIGLASAISHMAACIVLMRCLLKKDLPFRFDKKSLAMSNALKILRSGNFILINQAFFTLRTLLYNLILQELGGNPAIAAFAAYSTLITLLSNISAGISSTALMLSSIFYSEKDRSALETLVRNMVVHNFILTTAIVVPAEIFSPHILSLFLGNDPEVISFALPGLMMVLIWMIPANISNAFKYYYLGIRQDKNAYLIALLQTLLFNIPFVWPLGRLFGVNGFWLGSALGQFATLLAVAIISWRKYGKISFSPTAFCYLESDFGAKAENLRTLSVTDISSAVSASEELCSFCLEKGIDRRTSMLIGLSVEEISTNIIKYGFSGDKHTHNIDVRLLIEDDRRIIRIRDNCRSFDPIKYLELYHDSDPAAHIGLRMVIGMAKEASYINTLGLNNLILTL